MPSSVEMGSATHRDLRWFCLRSLQEEEVLLWE